MAESTLHIHRMHKAYGKSITAQCYQCCNYQLRRKNEKTMICIAYSNTVPWNGEYQACKRMLNIPFRGIRPRIEPLADRILAAEQAKQQNVHSTPSSEAAFPCETQNYNRVNDSSNNNTE